MGTSYPIGPIMKVKYFRLNVVFESSVTALWALVYVPDGLPIGRLNVAGSQVDSVPGAPLRTAAIHNCERCLHEPGLQRSVGAPASLVTPSQESQSGRRGVPRLADLNVCLIDPDYHHHQLLELRKLKSKALVYP